MLDIFRLFIVDFGFFVDLLIDSVGETKHQSTVYPIVPADFLDQI